MKMASAITAFNILQLLTLPSAQEVNNDFSLFNSNYNRLITKLFDVRTYEKWKPSHTPINIGTFVIVDHVENMDEVSQTLNFHGTLIMTWRDRRLVWDPRDYNNMNQTYISSNIGSIWTPPVYFRTLVRATTKVLQFHNTEIVLDSTGFVTTITGVTVATECQMDYTNYPFDNQTCSIMLVSPLMNSERMMFTEAPVFLKRDSLYGSQDNNMTSGAYFDVMDLTSQRFYYYPMGITQNETIFRTYGPEYTSTLLRFVLSLKRNPNYYMSLIALPLLASSTCAYVVACMSHTVVSLAWLVVCLVMQAMNIARMIDSLPPDYNTTPFCAKLAGIVFVETLLLLIYRFIMMLFYNNYDENSEKVKWERMQQIEYLIATVLAINGIVNLWYLVF